MSSSEGSPSDKAVRLRDSNHVTPQKRQHCRQREGPGSPGAWRRAVKCEEAELGFLGQ